MDTTAPTTQPQVQSTQQPGAQPNLFAQKLAMEKTPMAKQTKILVPLVLMTIFAGIGTGYVVASMTTPTVVTQAPETSTDGGDEAGLEAAAAVKVGQTFGAPDASAFKDSADGVLLAGGLEGEGSHRIVREGGQSQNVYLTSSIVDLKMFEGHSVKVYGETFKAQKAGWLMDVGRVEIKELNAELPSWVKPADVEEQSE